MLAFRVGNKHCEELNVSFHQTIIQGNLGKDPELKTLSSGSDVANFSVAVTEKWKSDGELQEHTEWYNVKVFGKQAEVCEKYLHKGDSVLLVGRLRTRKYEKDGDTKYATDLIVDRVNLLDNRGREDSGDRNEKPARREEPRRDSRTATTGRGEGRETRREEPRRARNAEPERASARTGRGNEAADDQDFDDDIPF